MESNSRFVVRDVMLFGNLGACAREVDFILRELDQCSERLLDKHPGVADAINSCADFLQGFLLQECGIDVCTGDDPDLDSDRLGSAVRRLVSLSEESKGFVAVRKDIRLALERLVEQFDLFVARLNWEGMSEEAVRQEQQFRAELLELQKQFGDDDSHGTTIRQRIVLVEDNGDERELLAAFLTKRGCEVQSFADGEEAIRFLHEEQPDAVVLLDMNLPNCHGAKVVQSIRDNPLLRQMQVIGMSGASLVDNRVSLGPDGLDFWLRKPFNPNAILDVIESRTRM